MTDTTILRALTVGRDVQTFRHGPAGLLKPHPCVLEKGDVIFTTSPKLRRYDGKPKLVVPFLLHGSMLLWVPVREMGLSEPDFDWAADAYEKSFALKQHREVTEEEFAVFKELGRPANATVN